MLLSKYLLSNEIVFFGQAFREASRIQPYAPPVTETHRLTDCPDSLQGRHVYKRRNFREVFPVLPPPPE